MGAQMSFAGTKSKLQGTAYAIEGVPTAAQAGELADVPVSPIPAVNVASVPQRSPLRYPGGKTWLIPHVRFWLQRCGGSVPLLIEPFAGGGVVSLTAVMEGHTRSCLMTEIDRDVAAFWHAALASGPELAKRVLKFIPTRTAVRALMKSPVTTVEDHGFRTFVLNRVRRGGILANGASFSRVGENGRGIASRWYPETLSKRILAIHEVADQIQFAETDGVALIRTLSQFIRGSAAVMFLDPPYTAKGKQAGKRLYNHSTVNHAKLFDIAVKSGVDFMMTYDCSPEILSLVREYRLHAVRVYMKNTHHNRIPELVITNSPLFEV